MLQLVIVMMELMKMKLENVNRVFTNAPHVMMLPLVLNVKMKDTDLSHITVNVSIHIMMMLKTI